MQDRQKSILFFVGDAGFFVSHRLLSAAQRA